MNGKSYRYDFGIMWPIDGFVTTTKAVNGVISTGPKMPYSFDRDCRHWHVDGSLTLRYIPVDEMRPEGWTWSNTVYRYSEGSSTWYACGLFPFYESPTMLIGDENFRIYRTAWVEGDVNYVSTYYRYWSASHGRFLDGSINLVRFTKGDPYFYIAKVRGTYTYDQWVSQDYTIKSWTPRVAAVHVSPGAPFVQPDLSTVKTLRLNDCLPEREKILGDLSMNCLRSLRVQDTSIVTDVVDTVLDLALGGLRGLFKKDLEKFLDVPNALAETYLALKYGIIVPTKAAIQSIRAYAKGVRSSSRPTKCYASSVIYRQDGMVTTARCRLMVDPWPDEFRRFMDNLYRLSFGVDFKDLWDLVPLSFLVDRFWHVDDVLSQDRARVDKLRYNIKAATYSLKTVKPIKREYVLGDGATDWVGEVQYVDYERWTEPGPILPNYSLTVPSLDGLGECWLDLTSVIVTALKRRRS